MPGRAEGGEKATVVCCGVIGARHCKARHTCTDLQRGRPSAAAFVAASCL